MEYLSPPDFEKMICFIIRFLVFAKVEKILGKYKKLCRYCEGEDSYLFWPPPVSFGKSFNFLVQFFDVWDFRRGWVVQFLNNYTKYAFFLLFLWCFTFFRYLCNAVREQRQPRTFFEMFEPLIKIFINLLITLQLWLLLSQPTFT